MKKLLNRLASLVLVFALCLVLVSIFLPVAYAVSGMCGENTTWSFDQATGTLTVGGTGAMKNYATYPYTDSPPWEYADWRYDIRTVEIKDGVTHIGNDTFNDLEQLTSVIIPDSVTSIGNTFNGCGVSICQLPKNLEKFGGAFGYCPNLTAFSVAEGNTAFCAIDGVLYDITGTTLVKFPMAKATSFEVPGHVTKIGTKAFDSLPLTSITLPSNVTVIGESAFCGCRELETIVIPEGVTTIEKSAFADCKNLKSISLPSTLTNIGENVFFFCRNLLSIALPANVDTICGNTFIGCDSLTELVIPSGVSHFEIDNSISWCRNLMNIYVDESNQAYSSIDGVLYDKEKKTLLKCPAKKAGTLSVPDGVTKIGAYAFCECQDLNEIILPNGLTTIGEAAFGRCRYGFEPEPLVIHVPDTVTQFEGDGTEQFLVPKIVFQGRGGGYVESFVTRNRASFLAVEMPPISATPNRSTVLVNGQRVAFDAYTINQNSYFKLRDLAKVLSGTGKQFEVTWDGSSNAIHMLSGKPYTVVGGELAQGDGIDKTASLNTAIIYLDGSPVQLTAYTINQNNYFKLRDVGQAFDFDVTWDGAQNTIVIDTAKAYTPD